MNKLRRKELYKLINKLSAIKNQEDLSDCIDILEAIKSDEEEYYDNAPENLQYSARYEASQEAIDNMDEALNYLNDALICEEDDEMQEYIDYAVSAIEDAAI